MTQADIRLENDVLEVGIFLKGAELCSIRRKSDGTEYLWNGDPEYWRFRAPILFPFVGGLKDKKYRVDGVEYPMNQHGFARDRAFEVMENTGEEIWLGQEDDEETRKMYPFRYRLELGYRLEGSTLKVMWRVKNPDTKPLYFSIGGHPGFMCPIRKGEKQSDYSLVLRDGQGRLLSSFTNSVFGKIGLVTDQKKEYVLDHGRLPIDEHLFDGDALILEHDQVQSISIADPAGKEYLEVRFPMPLVGIWSVPGKQAPFVCIEPWYGRCDKEGFEGELKDREWGNVLAPGAGFEASYDIVIK
ncbi:MAG TPA: aldose 1-epimerase family protein [Candidatus Onthocola gallistercoris]|uniref:Aldose 1-epimerase family protein n=1 Tax=Candidatus Onthocola gallistercoris TaxID=2840876 RepID=A0A9D1HEX8_9FIRM|nr:aldose 1-epimerase family protein [Candidatus Onthocola gallistercoris]